MTVSGADPNKPCIFPFIFNNETHYGCIWDLNDSYAWCSTKVDDQGNHIWGNWGKCDGSKCPIPDGKYRICIPRYVRTCS